MFPAVIHKFLFFLFRLIRLVGGGAVEDVAGRRIRWLGCFGVVFKAKDDDQGCCLG